MENAQYTIDTCCLIYGWKFYPPDIFPGLWTKLEDLINNGVLRATEEILIELKKNDDELLEWVNERNGFFIQVDGSIQELVLDVLKEHPSLYDLEKNKSGADPFVIALAMQNNCTVVTEEKKSGNPDKPKIPNVCDHYGIRHINLISLLREQGLVFSEA